MSFFFDNIISEKVNKKKQIKELSLTYGCKVCSFYNKKNLQHPKLEPTGSFQPSLYFLGDFLKPENDELGKHFVSFKEVYLREVLTDLFDNTFIIDEIRWNYCCRCYSEDTLPTQLEYNCCKSSIIKDIEETKPLIVVGLGEIPLSLFPEGKMISMWRGRIFPIAIGNHDCYYASVYSLSYVYDRGGVKSDEGFTFEQDIIKIGKFLEENESPLVIRKGYKDNIKLVTNIKDIKSNLEYFKNKDRVGIDLETYSPEDKVEKAVRPFSNKENKIVTCAISDYENTIAFPVDNFNYPTRILEYLKDFILNSGNKIAHNLSFELEWLSYFLGDEILWETKWDDTLAQAYTLDNRTHKDEGQFNLDLLIYRNFGFWLKALNSHINKKNILKNKIEDVLLYNGMDAKYTFLLDMNQQSKFDDIHKKLYIHLIHMIKSIVKAQTYGMLIDAEMLEKFNKDFKEKISNLEKEIKNNGKVKEFEKKFGEFNPSSSDHLRKLFKDILNMPELKQTKGGKSGNKQFAVDEFVITEYDKIFKDKGKEKNIASLILPYTAISTLQNTFIEGTKENIYLDGKVHTSFNGMYTSTGRFCVAKGTYVDVIRDVLKYPKGIPIEDVKVNDLVYSYDENKNLTINKVLWSGKTGHKKVIRIHWLGQGRKTTGYIDLTPEHEVRLINGNYKKAKDLTKKDRVLALHREIKSSSNYSFLYITGEEGSVIEHRFIYSNINNIELKTNDVIHHNDENKLNQNPNNLILMSKSTHSKEHSDRKPYELLLSYVDNLKKRKPIIKKGEENKLYIKLSRFTCIKLLAKTKGKPTKIKYDFTMFKDRCLKNNIHWKDISFRYGGDGKYISKGRLLQVIDWKLDKICKEFKIEFKKLKKLYKFYNIDKKLIWKNQTGHGYFVNKKIINNHIICKIEYLENPIDVYDLEIENTHNFIANELCIHNSHNFPNIAQYPKKKGKEIRNIMVAPDGFSLVAIDYGQIEARVLAMVSQDRAYIDALWNNLDIHMKWAERIKEADIEYYLNWVEEHDLTEVDEKKQLKEFRSFVKNQWVFALFYGGFFKNLARSMRLDEYIAESLFEEFKKEYLGVFDWHNKSVFFYKKNGYVLSPTNRRRYCPLNKNKIINTPIQGSASDIVTDAGYRLAKLAYKLKKPQYQFIFNIQDDLTYIVPDKTLNEDILFIAKEMVRPNFDFISVPLNIEISIGKRWGEMEDICQFNSTDFFDYLGECEWKEI